MSWGRGLPAGALTTWVGTGVVVVDQATKLWAVHSLSGSPPGGQSILNGWLSLILTTNDGAAFGLLADRGILFILVGLVLSGIVLIFARLLPHRRPLLQVSLGLQVGGAVSNLADRFRVGHVVDFIRIRFWPVFNLADSAIVCGVGLLVFYLLSTPDPRRGNGGQKQRSRAETTDFPSPRTVTGTPDQRRP